MNGSELDVQRRKLICAIPFQCLERLLQQAPHCPLRVHHRRLLRGSMRMFDSPGSLWVGFLFATGLLHFFITPFVGKGAPIRIDKNRANACVPSSPIVATQATAPATDSIAPTTPPCTSAAERSPRLCPRVAARPTRAPPPGRPSQLPGPRLPPLPRMQPWRRP
ncbi:hypothetical protein F5883DRAFT_65018 [Diaporthe sp. PMI_573]|nr:hypothetical protein F5883DRAFT_65018 [Diaporthaceae sp. PMI_573]